MIKTSTTAKLAAFSLAFFASSSMAALPQSEADRLGTELTPLGAQKEGNAAGTIPAWTGGLPVDAAPVTKGFMGNPFAGEEPLFVITASNYEQYSDNLSAGQIAMLRAYPETYRIPVYKTHRTAVVPDHINEAAKRSVLHVTTVNDGNGLGGFEHSRNYAFPIPQNGVEVVWNHLTRYKGTSMTRDIVQVSPYPNGSYSLVRMHDVYSFPQSVVGATDEHMRTVLFFMRQEIHSPARLAGGVLMAHETIDQNLDPRRVWLYNAGQRRVRRAPQVAFDGPGQASDGQRVADNLDVFNGSPERYDWKLVGKKEVYIPYNSYQLASPELKYSDLFQPGHIKQDETRYELHRVWEVVATLKSGERHVYAERHFYLNEDNWQIALQDMFDSRGDLWRVAEGHTIQYYNEQVPMYVGETLYDLQNRRYLTLGFNNEESQGVRFGLPANINDYSPGALRQQGVR